MVQKSSSAQPRYFDERNIPEDVWDVRTVASLLNIGEFRVFEIAFRCWYGKGADEKTIERYFMPYMFKGRVPSWVRHFCRTIIKREADNELDPRDYGIGFMAPQNGSIWTGIIGGLSIVVILIVLVTLAHSVSVVMPLACTFPPCY